MLFIQVVFTFVLFDGKKNEKPARESFAIYNPTTQAENACRFENELLKFSSIYMNNYLKVNSYPTFNS